MKKLLCRLLGHKEDIAVGIYIASLTEPGQIPRDVKIRMATTVCSRCGSTLKVSPQGIVYDPKFDDEKETFIYTFL